MRKLFLPVLALAALALLTTPAFADVYFMGGASATNLGDLNPADFDTDNVGFSGEVGVIGRNAEGAAAIGVEIRHDCRAGLDCEQAVAANVRAFIGGWTVQPYVSGGVGATFDGDPLVQVGAGLLYNASEDFGIYAGYKHRFNLDSFSDIADFGSYRDDDDGYVEIGIMLTF